MITRNCSAAIDDLFLVIALHPDFIDAIFQRGTACYFGEKDNNMVSVDITSSM